MKGLSMKLMSAGLAVSMLALPALTLAQYDSAQHRQQTKNEWRNIGVGAAALGLYGLLKGDSSLALAGAAGAAYAGTRYEQDRKSERRLENYGYGYYNGGYGYPSNQSRYQARRHDNGRHLGWYKNGRSHDQERGNRD